MLCADSQADSALDSAVSDDVDSRVTAVNSCISSYEVSSNKFEAHKYDISLYCLSGLTLLLTTSDTCLCHVLICLKELSCEVCDVLLMKTHLVQYMVTINSVMHTINCSGTHVFLRKRWQW